MIVHLIRHGKTEANEKRLYCGATDIPLSDAGRTALTAMAAERCYPPLSGLRVCTSGLLRTLETLEMIYGINESECIPELMEMDFGIFEMHSYDELKETPEYIAWITDETGDLPCPGGESSNGFVKRTYESFDSIIAEGRNALIICHGGVIARIMERAFSYEKRNFYEWQPSAGEGYTIEFCHGKPVSYKSIPV